MPRTKSETKLLSPHLNSDEMYDSSLDQFTNNVNRKGQTPLIREADKAEIGRLTQEYRDKFLELEYQKQVIMAQIKEIDKEYKLYGVNVGVNKKVLRKIIAEMKRGQEALDLEEAVRQDIYSHEKNGNGCVRIVDVQNENKTYLTSNEFKSEVKDNQLAILRKVNNSIIAQNKMDQYDYLKMRRNEYAKYVARGLTPNQEELDVLNELIEERDSCLAQGKPLPKELGDRFEFHMIQREDWPELYEKQQYIIQKHRELEKHPDWIARHKPGMDEFGKGYKYVAPTDTIEVNGVNAYMNPNVREMTIEQVEQQIKKAEFLWENHVTVPDWFTLAESMRIMDRYNKDPNKPSKQSLATPYVTDWYFENYYQLLQNTMRVAKNGYNRLTVPEPRNMTSVGELMWLLDVINEMEEEGIYPFDVTAKRRAMRYIEEMKQLPQYNTPEKVARSYELALLMEEQYAHDRNNDDLKRAPGREHLQEWDIDKYARCQKLAAWWCNRIKKKGGDELDELKGYNHIRKRFLEKFKDFFHDMDDEGYILDMKGNRVSNIPYEEDLKNFKRQIELKKEAQRKAEIEDEQIRQGMIFPHHLADNFISWDDEYENIDEEDLDDHEDNTDPFAHLR